MKKITRIFVLGHLPLVGFTRCCVASIRKWYPGIPITLIKDEIDGAYDTSDLEHYYGVEVFDGGARRYGWGMSRLEALFLPGYERVLILDSDIVLAGPVLERLEQSDADFVVCEERRPIEELRSYYFDPHQVAQLQPDFHFPGYVFNTGQMVATSGLLRREDFLPFMSFTEPRTLLQPEMFRCGEQGLLDFILLYKVQRNKLTLERQQFMRWPGSMRREEVDLAKLDAGSTYDFIVHWFGKTPHFPATMHYLLEYFEEAYYRGINDGGSLRRQHCIEARQGMDPDTARFHRLVGY